jgi:signal transduction histidine kinase
MHWQRSHPGMWFGARYFLSSRDKSRTSILHHYVTQLDTFRMRPAFEASLRRSKEQADCAARAASEALERAVAASRAKSEFLANMSHELRSPLNAIIGFSDLICRQPLDPGPSVKCLEYAKDIRVSGEYLLSLINDILDLASVEFGKATLDEDILDLNHVVSGCLRIILERIVGSSLNVTYDPHPDKPLLHADDRKLKQILVNLLSNAVKFTLPGGRVSIGILRGHNDSLELKVADTGIGIKPEDIEKAMAPFSQIDSCLSRKRQGAGLGLPLSKLFVELHGGNLHLSSQIGHGTTATVSFPANRVEWKIAQ